MTQVIRSATVIVKNFTMYLTSSTLPTPPSPPIIKTATTSGLWRKGQQLWGCHRHGQRGRFTCRPITPWGGCRFDPRPQAQFSDRAGTYPRARRPGKPHAHTHVHASARASPCSCSLARSARSEHMVESSKASIDPKPVCSVRVWILCCSLKRLTFWGGVTTALGTLARVLPC